MQATHRKPSPRLTRSVEDYLKVIYHLSDRDGCASTGGIAAELEVAAPSVSGMLKRLSEAKLIEYVPYRGVELTREGRKAAVKIIRRHRIIELYLTKHLDYHWDNVHPEAERLEHAVSDELIDKMAVVLGNPRYDPHGDPIPTAAGEIETTDLVPITAAMIGVKLELRQVATQEPDRLRYLAEQGLTPGVRLTVTARQPFNGPISLALGTSATKRVIGTELANVLWCREV